MARPSYGIRGGNGVKEIKTEREKRRRGKDARREEQNREEGVEGEERVTIIGYDKNKMKGRGQLEKR
jgi:hypothetical protein